MRSRKEKLKAAELFIKYDKSPASVIRELGYPCRATLYAWYEEYLANGCRMPSTSAHRRYTEDQKRAAIDHFFEHGRCLARTMRTLGYPSQELLAAWIDELKPGRRPKHSSARRFSHEAKEQAVIDLVARRGAAQVIADGLGIERATLYNWKRKLLSEEAPCKLPREKDDRSIEELEEYACRRRRHRVPRLTTRIPLSCQGARRLWRAARRERCAQGVHQGNIRGVPGLVVAALRRAPGHAGAMGASPRPPS